MNAPEQLGLDGTKPPEDERPHMVARVSALAVKIVFPFIAKDDIRYYLCGVNLRPLDDGTVMAVATDGHRFVVIRDPNGFTEEQVIVKVSKDGMKHAAAKNTFDVMSDGLAMISGEVAQPLFVQPGNSFLEGSFPRIENVASAIGYKEGISGAVNPQYLAEALEVGEYFGSIRFFTRDANSPLCFVCGGVNDMECFGGIMRLNDSFDSLPAWFPKPTVPTTLGDI